MNQPLIPQEVNFVGTNIHFQRHIQYWKRWTYIQFFFLILSIPLGVCYIAENNYKIEGDYVAIIISAQNFIQIMVYFGWRYYMKKQSELIKCAKYLKQLQSVDYEWHDENDMNYYYRYTHYPLNFKIQFKLGYYFRIHMYTTYYKFIPIVIQLITIGLVIFYFNSTKIYQWQYLTLIVITILIAGFDIIAVFTYPIYYFPKTILDYCRRKKHIKPYNPKKFDQQNSQCAICLIEYQKGEILYILPCSTKHFFHQQCIRNWINYQSICPFCRAEFNYLE